MITKEETINQTIPLSLPNSLLLSREVAFNQIINITTILRFKLYYLLVNFKETRTLNIPNTILPFEIKHILQLLQLYPLYQDIISSFIKEEIICNLMLYQSIYDKSILVELIALFSNHFLEWSFTNSSLPNESNQSSTNETKANYKAVYISFIKTNYIKIKLEKFFDIISNYPDSIPSLQDIKISINSFPQNEFVSCINKQTSTRLLTPGISTRLVIEIFIRIIKIMKAIEPSSYLLELISSPIKKYLRERKDTMQWIITTILSEDDAHIMADMSKTYVRNIRTYDYDYLSSDEEPETWEPINTKGMEGIELGNDFKNKATDIISTLVNIFGSPEKFMEQYKRMLSERKITDSNFSIENEIKNLELLKLKFGENLLQNCDVIIKDIKDSLKLNNEIKDSYINCLVVNKNFWPFENNDTLFDITNLEPETDENKMPESKYDGFLLKVKQHIEAYQKAFTEKRLCRHLSLYSNVGYVDLSLTFNNESTNCIVTPLSALIIQLFDKENKKQFPTYTLEYMSKKLNADIDLVKKKINFWITKGIMKEISHKDGSFVQYDTNDTFKCPEGNMKIIEEDIYSFDYPVETTNPKQLENSIMSVIKSSGPKNFEQLYKNLSISYQIGISKIKLKDLLGKLILEQKLFKDGDLYKQIIVN